MRTPLPLHPSWHLDFGHSPEALETAQGAAPMQLPLPLRLWSTGPFPLVLLGSGVSPRRGVVPTPPLPRAVLRTGSTGVCCPRPSPSGGLHLHWPIPWAPCRISPELWRPSPLLLTASTGLAEQVMAACTRWASSLWARCSARPVVTTCSNSCTNLLGAPLARICQNCLLQINAFFASLISDCVATMRSWGFPGGAASDPWCLAPDDQGAAHSLKALHEGKMQRAHRVHPHSAMRRCGCCFVPRPAQVMPLRKVMASSACNRAVPWVCTAAVAAAAAAAPGLLLLLLLNR